MKWHGQVREKQVDTGKVNQTVPTEPKGNREPNESLGNIITSKQCGRKLFQCTSLSELCSVTWQVSALHY